MIYIDAIGMKFLAKELYQELYNIRINKIVAYDSNSFSVFFQKKQLYFENKSDAIIFLKKDKIINTNYESKFISQLKKHIIGAVAKNIYTYNEDRIIVFELEKMNFLGNVENYRLIYEFLGKSVNVVLVDSADRIITNMFSNINMERNLIANSNYVLPNKVSPYGKYMSKLSENERNAFSNSYKPVIYENGLITYNKFLDMNYTEYTSLNEAFDEYFKINGNISILSNKKKPIIKYIKNNIKRLENILNKIEKDIENNKDYIKYKEQADILTSNIYLLKQGMENIELYNYYSNENIKITLDKDIKPTKNIQNLYNKYAKSKRKEEVLNERIKDIKTDLDYYKEQMLFLEEEKDILGIEEIERELNINKKHKIKSTKNFKRELYYEEIQGFRVYVGRNSYENEKITFEIAKSNDIWLHAKDVAGSHILIQTNNQNVIDNMYLIQKAATLAVKNSKNKLEGLVDYCYKKYVKKISEEKRGKVTYKEYKTIKIKEGL